MSDTLKLQAFLAHAGIASRRKAELLISSGLVSVNGKKAVLGQRVDPARDQVLLSGTPVTLTTKLTYYVLNKPRGVISTTQDELGRKNVLHLLKKNDRERVYPVGRLDQDSEGLMLLTSDGALCNILTHPKFQIEKTYEVLLKGVPSTKALEHLKRGVRLKQEYIKPVKTSILRRENGNTWLQITITEGQKHQVRKMMERIGYEVLRLVRVHMGPLELGDLRSGEYRQLNTKELRSIEELKQHQQQFFAQSSDEVLRQVR